MKFKFLLCIDDTDELGGEISTGLLAEEIAAFAGSFAPVSFVTRHQLLLDPRINYTSHNSCMCLEARLSESQKQSVLNFAIELLERKSAPSAEPGIAAAFEKDIVNAQELISFGKSAKEIFLSTERALETAREQNVFLKELKSGARGVIGALAGIGLRLSGNDGKIRGKFELKKSNLNVAELLGLNFIEAVADENLKPLSPNERVNLIGALKPVFLDFKATLLVKKEADGGFRNLSVKELRGF
jgi:thiazole biosynthesis protein thiG